MNFESAPRKQSFLSRDFVAYIYNAEQSLASELASQSCIANALTHVHANFLVAMRQGDTPVPIPNTMVKTLTADGTMLETAWESRWLPD